MSSEGYQQTEVVLEPGRAGHQLRARLAVERRPNPSGQIVRVERFGEERVVGAEMPLATMA